MKIEDTPRAGVSNDKVTNVWLTGDVFECVKGTFGVHSPAEPNARAGVRPGAFMRFRIPGQQQFWIEAPLSSLVCVGYTEES